MIRSMKKCFNYIAIAMCMMVISLVSCTRPKSKSTFINSPSHIKYENELFSVEIPKGWDIDASDWKGLDSMKNMVDIFDPHGILYLHFVKTFMPFNWKNIEEATEMAKTARAISGDNVELLEQIDSIEVGGYPASILYFANYAENDTIIQKQFVTYLQDSHIVLYFNESFRIPDWDEAQKLGDQIISTIKLKKIQNPLENDSAIKKAVEDGMKNHSVSEKYSNRAKELMNQMPQKE